MQATSLRGEAAGARLLLIVWCLVGFGGSSLARAAAQQRSDAASPARDDDGWCIVCDAPAKPGAITEVYKGRRVTVCNEACREQWHAHRETLFASLQARGALFDEKATLDEEKATQRSLFSGWFWFGTWVLVGLVCGAIGAYVALGKGLAPLPWLLAGLAFNVIALVVLATRPRGDLSRLPEGVPAGLRKIPVTHAPIECPKCGRPNHPSARACSSCGAPLLATVESETKRASGGATR